MIDIQTDDSAFRASLARLQSRLGNLTPVMQSIGMELESRISGRFESRTDPAARAWAPWAQSTVDSYSDWGNRRLLDRYGDMLASLSRQATANSVRIGFGQPYAAFHEFGTTDMPRRGLLFADHDAGTLGEGDQDAVMDILGVWLNGLVS